MLPPLWLLPMLQRIVGKKEIAFWHRLDLEMGKELELGVPPPDVWIEDVGWWVQWGLEQGPVEEGLPLLALGAEPMEVEGSTKQVQEDGAMVEDDAVLD